MIARLLTEALVVRRTWRPRHGTKLSVERSADWIERKAVKHIGKLSKAFLYGPIALIFAWLLAATGRWERLLKSYGAVALALWLAVDLWHFLLTTKWRWRFVAGWTATSLLFVGSMGLMWWWLYGVLQDQRADVWEHLRAAIYNPPSRDVEHSTFTVMNGGLTSIGKHTSVCNVNLIVYAKVRWDQGGVRMTESDVPIAHGGDAQSETCLLMPNGYKYIDGGPVKCADVTLQFRYSLVTQPDQVEEKQFRFATREIDGFEWHRQPVAAPHNAYCE